MARALAVRTEIRLHLSNLDGAEMDLELIGGALGMVRQITWPHNLTSRRADSPMSPRRIALKLSRLVVFVQTFICKGTSQRKPIAVILKRKFLSTHSCKMRRTARQRNREFLGRY